MTSKRGLLFLTAALCLLPLHSLARSRRPAKKLPAVAAPRPDAKVAQLREADRLIADAARRIGQRQGREADEGQDCIVSQFLRKIANVVSLFADAQSGKRSPREALRAARALHDEAVRYDRETAR